MSAIDFFSDTPQQVQEQEQPQSTIEDNLTSFMIKDLDQGITYDSREESKVAEINSQFQVLIPEVPEGISKQQSKAWNDYWRKIRRLKEDFFDCVQIGDLQGVKDLLEQQNIPFTADIKWHDEWTPVHYAANEGHFEVIEYLIQKGADLKAKTSFDYTAAHLASIRGSFSCVDVILQAEKGLINEQDKDFNTPLHYACKYGFDKIVLLLLDFNAAIHITNSLGNTPIEELQNYEILQSIINKLNAKGVTLSENILKSNDNYNRTIFHNNIMKNSRQDHVNKILKLTKSIDSMQFPSQSQLQQQQQQQQQQQMQVNGNSPILTNENSNKQSPLLSMKIHSVPDENTTPVPQQVGIGPQDFDIIDTLGKGAFGQVFLVQKKDSQSQYAMKVLQKERILGKKILKYALTERNVLSVMQHPFIVSLKYAFQTKKKLYLIMDYCPGGDLDHLLFRKGRLPESIAKIYICEIILALEQLHSKNILFRDLKPSNVVLDKDGHACITDFGLAKQGIQRGDITKSFCGSLAYLPPEMLNKTGHSQSLDWYLLGVLFYELLEGMPPYYSDSKQKLFENIRNANLKMPKNASDGAKSLLKGLLTKDSVNRLGNKGSEEVKNHPYFKEINWEDVYNKKLVPPVPKSKLLQRLDDKSSVEANLKVTISQEEQKPSEGVESNYVDSWDFNMKNVKQKGNKNPNTNNNNNLNLIKSQSNPTK